MADWAPLVGISKPNASAGWLGLSGTPGKIRLQPRSCLWQNSAPQGCRTDGLLPLGAVRRGGSRLLEASHVPCLGPVPSSSQLCREFPSHRIQFTLRISLTSSFATSWTPLSALDGLTCLGQAHLVISLGTDKQHHHSSHSRWQRPWEVSSSSAHPALIASRVPRSRPMRGKRPIAVWPRT